MSEFATVDEQLEVILRGAVDVVRLEELREKLDASRKKGTPLRIKFGMDPTAPDIHLGHTVVLRKLRRFQDFGHQAVLIIGDYTALVGDPSGRSKTRPRLTPEEIEANLGTYLEQVSQVLDMDRLEIVRNGSWFSGMKFRDVLSLAGKVTLARMIERDDFQKRMKAGSPVGLHETLYPLMQGWDSVEIKADVELGGTDQTFNLLVGRDLQRQEGMPPQVALTMPILVGLDGTDKMSKSLGNYVGITDEPGDMFGKLMSIPDDLMLSYFELLTEADLDDLNKRLETGENPRDIKETLALQITAQYHGEDAARSAAESFRSVFSRGNLPEDVPEVPVSRADAADWPSLLVAVGHAPSKSQARRLLDQGAVYLDGERVGPDTQVAGAGCILRTGKKRFARVRFE